MMRITNARERRVTLVMKLCDIVTGDTITGGRDIKVISGDGLLSPVVKPDGYFVFTGRRPDSVRISSNTYQNAEIIVSGHTDGVLRFALIPRRITGRFITVPENACIGFNINGWSLASELRETSAEICLQKDDFCDITDMYCAIVSNDSAEEAVYLEKNMGGGCYTLRTAPKHAYQVRGTRLFLLHRTPGGTVPVPQGADSVFIMSDGIVKLKRLEEFL